MFKEEKNTQADIKYYIQEEINSEFPSWGLIREWAEEARIIEIRETREAGSSIKKLKTDIYYNWTREGTEKGI